SRMEKIFFRDKQNALKGPFTESQVQEWYREKWFDSCVPFYFTKNDEKPTDGVHTMSLGELQSRYGIGCPFARATEDSETVNKRKEQLEGLEKKVESMKKECAQMEDMEKRLTTMEENLKNLEESPSKDDPNSEEEESEEEQVHLHGEMLRIYQELKEQSSSSETKKKKEKKKPAKMPPSTEEEYVPNWIRHFMKFFLDGYEALATNTDPESYWENPREMRIVQVRLGHVLADPPSKAILLRELKKAVSEKEYLYCAPCSQVLQN
ncbi:hypothetical protein PENTCL1PPCAC_25041, partial [Pristionchus entomophagus]